MDFWIKIFVDSLPILWHTVTMSKVIKKKVTFYLSVEIIKALTEKVRRAEVIHGESSRIAEGALRQFLELK